MTPPDPERTRRGASTDAPGGQRRKTARFRARHATTRDGAVRDLCMYECACMHACMNYCMYACTYVYVYGGLYVGLVDCMFGCIQHTGLLMDADAFCDTSVDGPGVLATCAN